MVTSRSRPFASLGLLLPALVTGAALFVAPRLHVAPSAGLILASATAVLPAIAALRVACMVSPKATLPALVGVLSAVVLAALYAHGLTAPWLLPVQNLALVCVGHAVGNAIGKRIEHPGHVLPAMVVAAAADIASVLHPSGPSHAIAASDRALGALALATPVPGDAGITFVLGAGDLVFAALLLAVAVRHGVSPSRVALLVLVGIGAALACASVVGVAVPALVPIGLITVAFVPPFRRLAPRDRATAIVAIVLVLCVLGGLFVRARLGGG